MLEETLILVDSPEEAKVINRLNSGNDSVIKTRREKFLFERGKAEEKEMPGSPRDKTVKIKGKAVDVYEDHVTLDLGDGRLVCVSLHNFYGKNCLRVEVGEYQPN